MVYFLENKQYKANSHHNCLCINYILLNHNHIFLLFYQNSLINQISKLFDKTKKNINIFSEIISSGSTNNKNSPLDL